MSKDNEKNDRSKFKNKIELSTKKRMEYGRTKFRKKLTKSSHTKRGIKDTQEKVYEKNVRKELAVKKEYKKVFKKLKRKIAVDLIDIRIKRKYVLVIYSLIIQGFKD